MASTKSGNRSVEARKILDSPGVCYRGLTPITKIIAQKVL